MVHFYFYLTPGGKKIDTFPRELNSDDLGNSSQQGPHNQPLLYDPSSKLHILSASLLAT